MNKNLSKKRVLELNRQKDFLKDRLSKIYLDKLDGIISEQFWLERHNKWTNDLTSINTSIQAYEKCNSDYMTTGVNILNTLCYIERCYLLSDTGGKKRILNMLLQNSTLKGGNIDYTYKKPFNIFAKGLNHLVNLGRKDSNL